MKAESDIIKKKILLAGLQYPCLFIRNCHLKANIALATKNLEPNNFDPL